MEPDDFFGEPIFSYTRAEALQDGVLIDVTSLAQEAGFCIPVAVTNTLWQSQIAPDQTGREHGQSEEGRMWDVLNVLRNAIRTQPEENPLLFKVLFSQGNRLRRVRLKAVCGPDDEGNPCITLMFPEED